MEIDFDTVVAKGDIMALLPLEQVNPSVGPLAYLDLFERAALETVSRACREEVRTPVLWRQLVIPASSKEAPVANKVLAWLFGDERYPTCASMLTSLNCRNLTDESIKAVAAGCASLTSLDVSCCYKITYKTSSAVKLSLPALSAASITV